MTRIPARSQNAGAASEAIEALQRRFVERLNALSETFGSGSPFGAVEWFRDGGRHGGGVRYEATDDTLFNRGSVNYSQVHYDDDPSKKLSSATAISTIIHPSSPFVPSMHLHISWTEMRTGEGYWRIMADLNPSTPDERETQRFEETLESASGAYYPQGAAQGERYFYIPALGRHRGVSHFYLEQFNTGDAPKDRAFASAFGTAVIDTYVALIGEAIARHREVGEADRERQRAYHTLYLLQVLTLDRGTTSGLLIHDQNDVGIMGSLPSHVDATLLRSWIGRLEGVQNELLRSIAEALGEGIVPVDEAMKRLLADVVRKHYRAHPEALTLQASGDTVPPTVDNHR